MPSQRLCLYYYGRQSLLNSFPYRVWEREKHKSYIIPRSQSLTGNAITEALPLLLWKAEPSEFIPIQSMGTRNEKVWEREKEKYIISPRKLPF
jgi:hypothetical protein